MGEEVPVTIAIANHGLEPVYIIIEIGFDVLTLGVRLEDMDENKVMTGPIPMPTSLPLNYYIKKEIYRSFLYL